MQKKSFFRAGILLLLSACFVFWSGISIAANLRKNMVPATKRHARLIDANEIAMMIMNNGTFARDPITGSGACFYPSGSDQSLIFVAGLRMAAKVNGEIRTACADYNTEYQPGIILPDGNADNPDLEKYRVYKIKPGDSADPNDPNYNKDYADWLLTDGAPRDENGLPLILGDQTLWCVMNDKDSNLHASAYNTQPLNIEVQLLAWAFDDDATPLGKTVFLQYTIINKGTDPITDAHIGFFVDPDLGDANDDGSACDTTLNLTYCYNRGDYDAAYGVEVPAVGICLLQGPVVPSPGDEAFQFMHEPIKNARLLDLTSNTVYY